MIIEMLTIVGKNPKIFVFDIVFKLGSGIQTSALANQDASEEGDGKLVSYFLMS